MPAVFSHGDLRLYLLKLLDESPHHGYDLMRALSDHTGGTYTPSAGTIYPRLAKLEDEGLVEKQTDGRKSVYSITAAGRAEVAARADEIDGIRAGLADSVRLIAANVRGSVQDAMRALRADLAAADAAARSRAKSESEHRADDAADGHAAARRQLQRAETVLATFRANVRSELRGRLARGGELQSASVDALEAALNGIVADVKQQSSA